MGITGWLTGPLASVPSLPGRKYTTFSLPNDLVIRLDSFLEVNSWGYRTRGEVMAEALRDFLRQRGKDPARLPVRRRVSKKRAKPKR